MLPWNEPLLLLAIADGIVQALRPCHQPSCKAGELQSDVRK